MVVAQCSCLKVPATHVSAQALSNLHPHRHQHTRTRTHMKSDISSTNGHPQIKENASDFPSESVEFARFQINLADSNSICGPPDLNSELLLGRTVRIILHCLPCQSTRRRWFHSEHRQFLALPALFQSRDSGSSDTPSQDYYCPRELECETTPAQTLLVTLRTFLPHSSRPSQEHVGLR